MPLFVRKFIVDAVEGAILGVLALNIFLPKNLDEATAQGAIVGAAILSAVIAAVRRNTPAGISWLREKLAVPTE